MATKAKPATKTRKAAPKRKVTPKKVAKAKEAAQKFKLPQEQTQEQQYAKVHAYSTLKNAGLPIPADLQLEVEALIAAAEHTQEQERRAQEAAITQEEKQIAKDNEGGPKWVRNAYPAPFGLRLERQHEQGSKRIELKPRGQRGDMFPLQENDLEDANLQTNLEIGLIEIIPNGVAKSILSKQTKNMSKVHTPIALLRGPNGKPYEEGSIKVEMEYNKQGVVVATTDPNIDTADDKQVAKAKDLGLLRTTQGERPEQVARYVPLGGNPAIISDGFATDNVKAKIADDIARNKDLQGPGAAGILSLIVEPTQKES